MLHTNKLVYAKKETRGTTYNFFFLHIDLSICSDDRIFQHNGYRHCNVWTELAFQFCRFYIRFYLKTSLRQIYIFLMLFYSAFYLLLLQGRQCMPCKNCNSSQSLAQFQLLCDSLKCMVLEHIKTLFKHKRKTHHLQWHCKIFESQD